MLMMQEKDYLILVDENDSAWGKLEKDLVHKEGLLHRAFSVFLFNTNGEMLLQQRADSKYHSGGLWTNTCCSHPRYGEMLEDAVERRLFEEMKLKCNVEYAFNFRYKAQLENGLIEHELDHVFIGTTDMFPQPDPAEVKSWKYVSVADVRDEMQEDPAAFTIWFQKIVERVVSFYFAKT